MGLYSDSLRERARRDAAMENEADDILLSGKYHVSQMNHAEQTRQAINFILDRFDLSPAEAGNCETTEEMLDVMLDPEDIMYVQADMRDHHWKDQCNLVLAFLEDDTPVVLQPHIFGYRCYCPSRRKHFRLTRKVKLQPKGYTVFKPIEGGQFSVRQFLMLMFRFVSLSDIPCIAGATLAVAALGLVAPDLSKMVLDITSQVTDATKFGDFLTMTADIFILAGILKGVFTIVKSHLLDTMKLRISTQMQTAIMAKVLLMPYDYFINASVGKQSVQIRSAKQLTNMLIDFFMNNCMALLFSLIYIPQMNFLVPELVIPALAILAVQIIVSTLLCVASAKNARQLLMYQQESDTLMYELMKGIQKIKGIGAEKRAYSLMAGRYSNVLKASLEPPVLVRLSTTINQLVSLLGTLIILILAVNVDASRASYLAFVTSYGLVSATVYSMMDMGRTLITINPLLEQMRQLFDYKPQGTRGRHYIHSLNGGITVEDLSFTFKDTYMGCIDKVNLHIRPGEKVAFVGESGCGKSTLMKLLLGLLLPDSGSIFYDGMPLTSFHARSFRKRIGSIFQFSRVLPGTIFDNIALTSKSLTIEEAWEAAEAAQIAEDIRELPMGMDTEISEGNGGGFSGGQKQRILLARAFAQKPDILILDEATSALDNVAQNKVLSHVYDMDCTVLMVAHRLTTVKKCDRIIVLKDGRIVEEGSYDKLMEMNGEFAELVRKQQEQPALRS